MPDAPVPAAPAPAPAPAPAAPALTRSWRTTLFGSGGVLAAIMALVVFPLLDEDPATVPHWAEALAIVVPAVGLLFARDHGVTSEQAGAK